MSKVNAKSDIYLDGRQVSINLWFQQANYNKDQHIQLQSNMLNQGSSRKKTAINFVQDDKQGSNLQVASLGRDAHNSQLDSSKYKQMKFYPTRKSNWNKKEKIRYVVFLNYYSQIPNWGNDLKSIPSYKALSQFIKTRSPEQCKSFHLSMRRNFRTIDQMVKSMHQQLQIQEAFQKLLDRYDFQIIAFQEQHKILEMMGLQQKKYFQNKLIQKYKQTGLPKEGFISAGQPILPQDQFNFKINIKQLIKQKQIQQNKIRNEDNNPKDESHLQSDKSQKQDQMKPLNQYINQANQHINQTNQNVNQANQNMTMNNAAGGINFQVAQQDTGLNSTEGNNTQKTVIQSLKQANISQNASLQQKRVENANQRLVQQNFKRMMQGSKNPFSPFPNYVGYGPTPFGGMERMHMSQYPNQINQMQFSMPPPGGMPYLMPNYAGYPFPQIQNRFVPTHQGQPDIYSKKSQRQNNPGLDSQKRTFTNQEAQPNRMANSFKAKQQMDQARRELVLKCHQHWVNWIRGVTQLNRRRQGNQMGSLNKHQ